MPRILSSNSTLVTCLFSCVTEANVRATDLAQNSVVVAYRQSRRYHGTLWTHPASSPFVRINTDPVTYIQMALAGRDKRKLAGAILVQRDTHPFTYINEFESFVHQHQLDVTLIADYEKPISFC